MLSSMRAAACLLIAFGLTQQSAFPQTFEVATVKPAPPGLNGPVGQTGGPGTNDPTRVRFTNYPLGGLIMGAYDISYFQLSGPAWVFDSRFEVVATLPADTTKEQFHTMLQNLLAERFKLTTHRERKKMDLYSLTVAPGGPKFKDIAEGPPPPTPNPSTAEKDGFPTLAPGSRAAMTTGPKGAMYIRVRANGDDAMTFLLSQISGQLSAPVEDATGLTGNYDFTLSWVFQSSNSTNLDASPAGPDVFRAVQDQLGLKLTAKKGDVEMIVVDHAEKQPSEN